MRAAVATFRSAFLQPLQAEVRAVFFAVVAAVLRLKPAVEETKQDVGWRQVDRLVSSAGLGAACE